MEKQNTQSNIHKLFLVCSILIFLLYKGDAQNFNSGLTVKMNGYVVNMGGQVLFQPCEDSTKNIFQCLNNTSFVLGYFSEDMYLEAIENIGDSLWVQGCFLGENGKYPMKINYFYCTLEDDMMILDTIRFKVYKQPKYEITFEGRNYSAYGFYVDNRIKQIVPWERKNLLLMYNYYSDRNYQIPVWLNNLVHFK